MSQYEIDAYEIKGRERNIPLEGRTIYLDLCGLPLQQSTVDIITQEANHDSSQPVNIIIRRLSAVGGVPRLIVDSRAIYDAAAELLVQRERANREDSGMAENERGRPYSIEEAERAAEKYPDEYIRELVRFLTRRIQRLESK